MNARISLWLLILFIVGGIGTGYYFGSRTEGDRPDAPDVAGGDDVAATLTKLAAEHEALKAKHHELRTRFAEISRVDMAEYLRLQDADARLQKVNEILGKVFLLFMNYLMVDVPADQAAFAERAAGTERMPSEPSIETDTAKDRDDAADPQASSDGVQASTSPQPVAAAASWTAAESGLAGLTADKASAFLDKAVIKDLRPEIKNARAFNDGDQRFARLQGAYAGEVTFFDGKADPWKMELDTQASIEDGKPQGTNSVRLYKSDGQKFSDSSGGGKLDKQFINMASQSNAILLSTGMKHYFQLYHLEADDTLVGNYYELSEAGEFRHLGRVRLSR